MSWPPAPYRRLPDGSLVWGQWATPEIELLSDKLWSWSEQTEYVGPSLGLMTIDEAILLVEDGLLSAYGDYAAAGIIGVAPLGLRDQHGAQIKIQVTTEDFPG